MRQQLFDPSARKRTVSLTLNADLYAKAKGLGLNASRIAEAALADALARHWREEVRAEIEQDLEAYNGFVARHGSPADWVREHYGTRDDAA